jgi:integrase
LLVQISPNQTAWTKLPDPFPLILETMAMSGMRLGETLAMRWENLDIRGCQYNITETPGKEGSVPPKAAGGS